jgi:hypothetical protein
MSFDLKEQDAVFVASLKEHVQERIAIQEIDGEHFDEIQMVRAAMAWRAEIEAKHCLDFYSLEERRAFLDAVEKKRGSKARKVLEAAITKEWKARKSA